MEPHLRGGGSGATWEVLRLQITRPQKSFGNLTPKARVSDAECR